MLQFFLRCPALDYIRCLQLRLLPNYLAQSSALYAGDAEGQSRRVLFGTCMALLVDRHACINFPMLRGHKVGVDMGMLSRLLVPLPSHRRLLDSLEKYVWSRDEKATYPATIEPNVSSASFAVRFHSTSNDAEKVRLDILEQCRKNQVEKKKEVAQKLQQHEGLISLAGAKQSEANGLFCQYTRRRLAQ